MRVAHLILWCCWLALPVAGARGQSAPDADSKAAPAPEAKPASDGIRETQVSIVVETERQRSRFRGTVLGKSADRLTVLTAAHCLSDRDVGKTVRISRGEESLRARIKTVVHNPYYRQTNFGDSPGADNAIVHFEDVPGKDRESELFRTLGTADITDWPLPDPNGRPIAARMIDQFGTEHVVRAGNFSNPRWLEWGPSYRPKPGDSGSGVFIVTRSREGNTRPVLIGVVVDRSDNGGGASLLCKRFRWVAEAAPAPAASPGAPADEPPAQAPR